MSNYLKLIVFGLIAVGAMMAINFARDTAYMVHGAITRHWN